jgi:AAA domain
MSKAKLTIAQPEQFEGNVLMRMRMEHCKRVRLIDLSFNEPLTIIGGDFSQGKSTFLSGFEWCFGGKAVIDANPVQDGKQSGTILCEIGDGEKVKLRVHCTLERVGESGFNRTTEVEIPGYLAPSKIQDFLEKLAGRASFDPLHFNNMAADKQYETLRNLVGNFDFAGNKATYEALFKQRTIVNGDQKREQAAADAIAIAESAPHVRVEEDVITNELEEAGKKNANLQQRQSRREEIARNIERLRAEATAIREGIDSAIVDIRTTADNDIADLELQIKALQARIAARRTRIETDIEAKRKSLDEAAIAKGTTADDEQKRLDEAEPLPDPIPTEDIVARLNAGRITNKALTDWETLRDRKAGHQKAADEYAEEAADFTEQLDSLDAARRKAIEEAKLPVAGIGFGDGFVTLNGAPWKQAGESERIDASTAIGMALNPKIKTILIRHGSGVAKRMRDRIRERAAEKGYRVLMEVVDTPEGTNVVIEDGAVKEIVAKQSEAVPA